MGFLSEIKIWILLEIFLTTLLQAAVMPPPWADPDLNPCAKEPRGWQLLYWPPDGECYKIFQVGYPCPDGMELTPATTKNSKQLFAECRCPPKTAMSVSDEKCYPLFSIGPCQQGLYFGPHTEHINNNTSTQQRGTCIPIKTCPSANSIFWMKDGKCYQKLTRGPCPKGQLLTVDSDKIPLCTCNKQKELRVFRTEEGRCYQHFTKGPCREKGQLFLPDKSCGCHSFLPHFHGDTRKCYELGTIGPCQKGEMFTILPKTSRGGCVCKLGNIRYRNHASCHRPFTQGPCEPGRILLNTTSCISQPCRRGELFYPLKSKCFRIGVRGPCPKGRVLSFDFDTRPSIDGVSYNGVCMCQKKDCSANDLKIMCDRSEGLLRYGDSCYRLYAQGPCDKGAWLAPKRQGKELLSEDDDRVGVCECVPGHVRRVRTIGETRTTECLSPTSVLADYLNRNFTVAQVIKL